MITPLLVALLLTSVSYIVHDTNIYLAIFLDLFVLLSLVDSWGRVKEYQLIIKCLSSSIWFQNNDWDNLIRKYRHSHCQRQTLLLAAYTVDPDYDFHYINKQLHELGYRWYHITPDWLFKKPGTLLTLKFWKVLIGVK